MGVHRCIADTAVAILLCVPNQTKSCRLICVYVWLPSLLRCSWSSSRPNYAVRLCTRSVTVLVCAREHKLISGGVCLVCAGAYVIPACLDQIGASVPCICTAANSSLMHARCRYTSTVSRPLGRMPAPFNKSQVAILWANGSKFRKQILRPTKRGRRIRTSTISCHMYYQNTTIFPLNSAGLVVRGCYTVVNRRGSECFSLIRFCNFSERPGALSTCTLGRKSRNRHYTAVLIYSL